MSSAMNVVMLNTASLDDKVVIKGGSTSGGGNTGGGNTGGGTAISKPINDVNFFDCDGTVLHSYTKDEFLALSTMPALPTREGFICQEWNWDYEDAQEYVAEYGICDIGATYITDDGKTRLYIKIPPKGRLYQGFTVTSSSSKSVKIDWGDGTPVEYNSKYGNNHTYASEGEYMITLEVLSGVIDSFTASSLLNLVKAEVGSGFQGNGQANFAGIRELEFISLPKDFTPSYFRCGGHGSRVLILPKSLGLIEGCYGDALQYICIPNSPIVLQSNAFQEAPIRRLVIPNMVTFYNTPTDIINNCKRLNSLIVPKSVDGVPTIAGSSGEFTYLEICNGNNNLTNEIIYNTQYLKVINFEKCESIPTMGNTNVFRFLPSDCKIIVPDALYDEWIAATNWTTYASKIIKKSDWDASQS